MYRSEKVNSEFDKLVDYKTSMRSLKVRGVYETYKEAEVRAKALQRRDQVSMCLWELWALVALGSRGRQDPERRVSERRAQHTHQGIQKESGSQGYALRTRKGGASKGPYEKKIAEEELEKQERENAKAMANIEDNLEQDDPWMAKAKSSAAAADEN